MLTVLSVSYFLVIYWKFLTDKRFIWQFPALIRFFFFQLVHFVNRDSLGLANDFLSLGFIPEGVDVYAVSDALKASFADRTSQSRDFQVLPCVPPPRCRLWRFLLENGCSLPP